MQISVLGIAKVGWPFILGGLSAAFGVAAIAAHLRMAPLFAVSVMAVVFSAFCSYFFRDPSRVLPNDPSKIYATGDGLSQDDTESARWLQLAAEQGYADAQHNLGVLFILGQGVPQDYVLAHMWLNLAASRQDGEEADDSATARDSLAAKMTPEQIAESQALAREWKPKTWEALQPE